MARSKLNTLFKKTEPATQEQIDAVYLGMNYDEPDEPETAADPVTPAPKQEPKTKRKPTVTPHSVYISKPDYEIIKAIAAAYNETPHAVLQYAVRETIRKWKRTKKLKTNEDGKLRK